MGRYILPELNPSALPEFKFQVITPSKAIASYLKVPHYSLESLARNMVRRQGISIASILASRRWLQDAVREVLDPPDVEGTASAFLSTVKDLLRSGIDPRKLQLSPDLRIRQLGELIIAYRRRLRKFNRIDAAELYWQGTVGLIDRKAYTFYGYVAPARDELAIIEAIAGEDSILVLPADNLDDLYPQQGQIITWLQSRGWELSPRKTSQAATLGAGLQNCFRHQSDLPQGVRLNVFANLEEEVHGVLTRAKMLLSQGVAAKDIVLVTNDEQLYGKLLIDLAWEYSIPVEVCYEIPLAQTRIGAWLNLLLEAIADNFSFEITAKLLSHPLANLMTDEIWSQARQTHPQGITAWQNLGFDLSLLDFAVKQRRDSIAGLANILSAWDILEKAKSWAREIVAYYRLQEGLRELSQPEAQPLTKQAFIAEITEILALLTVPAQPGMGGIELHNPKSLFGTNYPHVFLLGSMAGILPTAIADNPILDFHHRRQLARQGLNVETAVAIAQRETFQFYSLLNVPTRSITFSYAELVDNNHTIPSPYLSRLRLEPTTPDLPVASLERARQRLLRRKTTEPALTVGQLYLRQPSSLPETSSILLPSIARAWQVESDRESAKPPNEYDGAIAIGIDPQSKIFSASQLTQLGQCPFKWFSARLLQLTELEEAESDLSAAVRGSLYHRCLELSLREINTAQDLAEFLPEQLTEAFATAERELELTDLPGWEARREEHLNLLALNLTAAEFLPPEREVIATETEFGTQWYGLQVRGQVDRIDRSATGLTVIDYKTSGVTPAGVKDATGKANLDIQLALYQDAIAQIYADEAIDTAAYYSLTKQKTISRPRKDPVELAAFAQRVKVHLERGYFPVAPDLDRHACRYCDYDPICRRGDRLSRKPSEDRVG